MDKQTTAVDLRWLIRRDMPEVVEIEQRSFPEPYSEDELVAFMRQRNCVGMVAESPRGHVIHGYMIYELHKEHLEILTVAVAPESRGTGVGTALIDRLKGKCSIQRSTCDGNPRNWGPIDSMVVACPDCHFGWRGGKPCTLCPFSVDVDGDASFGFLPEGSESSEIIDGGRFDGGYMARLRTLPGDIEYRLLRDATIRGAWKYSQWDVLAFRWGNGGKGFLCGLELKE